MIKPSGVNVRAGLYLVVIITYEFNKDSSYQFEIKFENGDALSFSLVNEKDIGDVSNWLKDIVHTGTQLKKKINYQISRPIVKSTPLEN